MQNPVNQSQGGDHGTPGNPTPLKKGLIPAGDEENSGLKMNPSAATSSTTTTTASPPERGTRAHRAPGPPPTSAEGALPGALEGARLGMHSTHKQTEGQPRERDGEETHVSGGEEDVRLLPRARGTQRARATRNRRGPGVASLTGALGMGKGRIALETRGLPTDSPAGS